MRVHQDFTRNVLRGAKPHIVKDVREHLGKDLSLDNFKYWTALVRAFMSLTLKLLIYIKLRTSAICKGRPT